MTKIDKHGIGTVGLIIAMVIAGLIVYMIIYYGPEIVRRIGEGFGSSGHSTAEIKQHPESYLGKTITIEGWYVSGSISSMNPIEVDTQGEAVEFFQQILFVNLPENVQVFESAKYRFVGVVIAENNVFGQLTVRFDASEVEPI